MEIASIKQRLAILTVIHYYGLSVDRHNKMHCPFHDDKTPSMQLYPNTNTWCCFSANCKAGTGDVIDFIQQIENCTKHEAILKAKDMAGGEAQPTTSNLQPVTAASTIERTAVLTKAFQLFRKALPNTKKAVAYLQSRNIDYKQTEAGSVSASYHHDCDKDFVQSLATCHLLKPLPAKGYSVWAKDCIVFPLRDATGNIVSLYGRSTLNETDARHFYLKDRQGLYPAYPKAYTKKLILTEGIIDAASLLQQEQVTETYTVLALYGTNGLTDEHIKAIIHLPELEEIIFMLDGDDAGKAATAKHYNTLQALLPEVTITTVPLPEGEDINSIVCAHDDKEVLLHLIEARTTLNPMPEAEPITTRKGQTPVGVAATAPYGRLDTTNAELFTYDTEELYIQVLGGIKTTGLDRMKVTLKIIHKEQLNNPQWFNLDLYNHVQREQTISSVSESFEMTAHSVSQVFTNLITALENYRIQTIEHKTKQQQQPKTKTLTEAEKAAAIKELKHPNLLTRTRKMLEQCGIVGEAENSMIAYLVYNMRKQPTPLHIMFLGSSGSGKTYLQEGISELIPEEDKIEITQITENALYYFKQDELKNKLLLIEDLDGATGASYSLRELQSKKRISKTVTLKDSRGNLKTVTLTVEGPVCVSGCTTKEKLYEDNANRCILLYTDQSREQDKRINAYQTHIAAGAVNKTKERQYKELFKDIQRMLQPIHIINPYASCIQLPEQVFKPRRTMALLLGFIEAVTFYHQWQREIQQDDTGKLYIATTVEDIQQAFDLLKDVLFSKSDELTKATRGFLEQLKMLGKQSFTAKEIRQRLRTNPNNMKRYLIELDRYGYIKGSGNRYRSYEYTIQDMSEYESLKSSIDKHLQQIITTIKKQVSGSLQSK